MGIYIDDKIAECNKEIKDLESRIYENGKRKQGISTEYFEEKYMKIEEQKRQKRVLERIALISNPEMKVILLPTYKWNNRDNAIIVVIFDNGKKMVYRGCTIYYDLTTNYTLTFENDAGLACININKIASINIAYHGSTYEEYVPELSGEIVIKDADGKEKIQSPTVFLLNRLEMIVDNAVSEITETIRFCE